MISRRTRRTTHWALAATLAALAWSAPTAIAQGRTTVHPHAVPARAGVAQAGTTAVRKAAARRAAQEKRALARFIATEYDTSEPLASRIVNAAYAAGARHQLSPALVLAIISRESTFNPRATSGYGAQGLMQVVPRFHQEKLQEARAVTARASLFDPETNIDVGTRILAEYLDAGSGLRGALRKYSGSAPRYAERVLQAHDAFERVRREAGEGVSRTA